MFEQKCLNCVETIYSDNVPHSFGTQLHETKPNDILHFDFLYIELSRDGKRQYILLLKGYLRELVYCLCRVVPLMLQLLPTN
jgi:hypothetical protein